VIAIELLGCAVMTAALVVDWRLGDVSRWGLALWSAALLATVVAGAWAPVVALFGLNVGGRAVLLALEGPE
jgi:hypothetical protein